MSRTGPSSPASMRRTVSAFVRGVAAAQVVDRRARQAEVAGVEVVLVHLAARDLPDVAVAGRRQLVEAVVAAEHERGRPAGLEDADEQRHLVELGDADGGRLRPRGVAQRAEEVEHRRDAELGAGGSGVPEARVEQRGERERDAHLIQDLRDALRAGSSGRRRARRARPRSRPRSSPPCCRASRRVPRRPRRRSTPSWRR